MKKVKIYYLLICMLLVGCGKQNHHSNDPQLSNHQVSLIAVGDNLIHQTIYQSVYENNTYDFRPIYQEIKDFIQLYDLKFINQETILGGSELGLSSYPCFNSPLELGDALIDTGFNLFSMANNHTLDRGEKAIKNAIKFFEENKVIYSGAATNNEASQVKRFNKNGILFAFVAYTYGTNGIKHPEGKTYLANIYSQELAKKDLEDLDVDVKIVSMHWGEEYQDYPSKTQIDQAKYLSTLKVDIIIGHHPHVIQPVAMLNRSDGGTTFVIYSLGNFLSDQKGIDRLIGMAISIEIIKKEEVISLKNPEAKLIYRYKDNNNFRIKLYEKLTEAIIVDYDKYYLEKKNLIKYYYPDIKVG